MARHPWQIGFGVILVSGVGRSAASSAHVVPLIAASPGFTERNVDVDDGKRRRPSLLSFSLDAQPAADELA